MHKKTIQNKNTSKQKPTVKVVKTKRGHLLFINGKKMIPVRKNGVEIPFSLVKNIELKELIGFSEIYINIYPCDYADPSLIDYINSGVQNELVLKVIDNITVDAVITIFDDFGDGLHEIYQLTLETIVKENPDLITYTDVKANSFKELATKFDLFELKNKSGIQISYTPVGFVQFSTDLFGIEFKDIYRHLANLLVDLDKKTRERISDEYRQWSQGQSYGGGI